MISPRPSYVKSSAFRGGAQISLNSGPSTWVLATSGNINDEIQRPSMVGIDMPAAGSYNGTADPRSRFLVAKGTETFSGSISFDLTDGAFSVMKPLMTRRCVGFSMLFAVPEENNSTYRLDNCYMQNLSLSGSIDGILTVSLSFISAQEWKMINNVSVTRRDILSANYEMPLTYWYSGNPSSAEDLREWTLSVTQETQAVFGNTLDSLPLYIRCGTLTYEMSATTYLGVRPLDKIMIKLVSASHSAPITFEVHGVTTAKTASFSPGEVVSNTHNFGGFLEMENGSIGNTLSVTGL